MTNRWRYSLNLVVLAIMTLLSASCADNSEKFWGEKPAQPKVIVLESAKGCPSIEDTMDSGDSTQLSSFDCYDQSINEVWKVLEKDQLTFKELEILVNKKILSLSSDEINPPRDLQKIRLIFDFLGLENQITRRDSHKIIDWIRKNRVKISEIYQTIVKSDNDLQQAQTIEKLADILHSYLESFRWHKSFDVAKLKKIFEVVFEADYETLEILDSSIRLFGLNNQTELRQNFLDWCAWTKKNISELDKTINFFNKEGDLSFKKQNHLSYILFFKNFIHVVKWNSKYNTESFISDIARLFEIDNEDKRIIFDYAELFNFFEDHKHNLQEKISTRLDWWEKSVEQIQSIVKLMDSSDKLFKKEDVEKISVVVDSFVDIVNWAEDKKISDVESNIYRVFPEFEEFEQQVRASAKLLGLRYGSLTENTKRWSRWSIDHSLEIERVISDLRNQKKVSKFQFENYKNIVKLGNRFIQNAYWPSNFEWDEFIRSLYAFEFFTEAELFKANSAAMLFDLRGGRFQERLIEKVNFAENNWDYMTVQYERFENGSQMLKNYSDLSNALFFSADLLGQILWEKDSLTIATHIKKIVNIEGTFSDTKTLSSLLDLFLDFGRTLCPSNSAVAYWRPYEFKDCLYKLEPTLRKGGPWFDYALNKQSDLPKYEDINGIKASISAMEEGLKLWFKQPNLSGLHTNLWTKLATSAGAEPPKKLLEGLKIFRKFGSLSNENFIQASVFSHFATMLRIYEHDLLNGLPVFYSSTENRWCQNKNFTTWKNCKLPKEILTKSNNPSLKKVTKINNINFGLNANPIDGDRFSTSLLFNMLATEAIKLFDNNNDGLVKVKSDDEDDEVISLLVLGVEAVDSLQQLWINYKRKRAGEEVVLIGSDPFYKGYDLKGLARLLTLAGTELLVQRTHKQSNILKDLIDNLILISPKSAVFLDDKGLAAVALFINSLSNYKKEFLKKIDLEGVLDQPEQKTIDRNMAKQGIAPFLKSEFPRTFKWCHRFNYDASCGVLFEEFINLSNIDNSDQILIDNLDYITIATGLLEGILDSCDWDGDQKLEFKLLKGNDELTCTTTLFVDITNRLFESKIVESEGDDPHRAILSFLKLHELTRVFGKFAIIKGSTKGLLFGPLKIPVYTLKGKKANLGSMIGLLADIINPKRARSYKSNVSVE